MHFRRLCIISYIICSPIWWNELLFCCRMSRSKASEETDKQTRIAIVSEDKCKPKRCRQECKKSCPVVRMGKLCIEVSPNSKIASLSEELCIGCGICVKVVFFIHFLTYFFFIFSANLIKVLGIFCLSRIEMSIRCYSNHQYSKQFGKANNASVFKEFI